MGEQHKINTKYGINEEDLIGELKGIPLHIVECMLKNQVLQGNPMDVKIFQKKISSCKKMGGFDWWKTSLGWSGWKELLNTYMIKDM